MATLHAKRANSKRLQQTLVEVLVPTTPVTRLGVGNRPVVRFEKDVSWLRVCAHAYG